MNGKIPLLGKQGERHRLIEGLADLVRMAEVGNLDGYVVVAFKGTAPGKRLLRVASTVTPGEAVLLLLHGIDAYKGGLSTGEQTPEGPAGLAS